MDADIRSRIPAGERRMIAELPELSAALLTAVPPGTTIGKELDQSIRESSAGCCSRVVRESLRQRRLPRMMEARNRLHIRTNRCAMISCRLRIRKFANTVRKDAEIARS